MKPEIPHPPFIDKMIRFHAQIDQAMYAAEITCDTAAGCPKECPFNENENGFCNLDRLRELFGEHVKQDDASEVHP